MKMNLTLGEFSGVSLEENPERSYALATEELTSQKYDFLRIGDLDRAGHAARALAECFRRTGNTIGADKERREALNLFGETRNIRGIAWTEWNIGTDLRQRGFYMEANRHLLCAYQQAHSTHDIRCALYSLAGIAETDRILGHYQIALPKHVRLLREFRRLMDPRGIAWAYEGIGQIKKNQGLLSVALRSFEVARKVAEESSDIRGLGWALKGLGEVRSLVGQSEEGLASLRLSLEIFRSSGAWVAQAYTQKVLGDVLLKVGRIDDAAAQYLDANRLFLNGADERGIAYVLVGMGDLHWKLGLREASISLYKVANEIFLVHRLEYGLSQCSDRFARAKVQWKGPGYVHQWEVGQLVEGKLPELLAIELVGDLKGAFLAKSKVQS